MNVEFKKKDFFVIEEPLDNPKKVKYSGYSFVYEGKKWFAHKLRLKKYTWVTTDPYTTYYATYGRTRKDAVKNLIESSLFNNQNKLHIEAMGNAIAELKKAGVKLPVNR